MVMPMGFGMGTMSSGNAYDNMKARYGYAPVDFTERPRVAGYPMETVPQSEKSYRERSWFERFLRKLFN